MNSSEILARVGWNYLVEPGDRIAGTLVEALGPEEALERLLRNDTTVVNDLSPEELVAAYARWQPRLERGKALAIIKEAKRRGIFPIVPGGSWWPDSFESLSKHQPLMLWGLGHPETLKASGESVSLVGSRTVTNYGNWATYEIAEALCELGVAVVSGGALGVDSVAHRAALRNKGVTVAIMAGGLFNNYPAANAELFDQISQSGILLSEMTPEARPTRWRFLQRNRLIAALGRAVIVTEAGYRSGSINTVNHALELDRPVFALPGQINSPNSAGCNRLISEGKAEPIIDIEQLLIRLGYKDEKNPTEVVLGQFELRLLDALTRNFQDLSKLAVQAGLGPTELRLAVGGLELAGLVKRDGQMLAKSCN